MISIFSMYHDLITFWNSISTKTTWNLASVTLCSRFRQRKLCRQRYMHTMKMASDTSLAQCFFLFAPSPIITWAHVKQNGIATAFHTFGSGMCLFVVFFCFEWINRAEIWRLRAGQNKNTHRKQKKQNINATEWNLPGKPNNISIQKIRRQHLKCFENSPSAFCKLHANQIDFSECK